MPNELNRRDLLRFSAFAGAGALTTPLRAGAGQRRHRRRSRPSGRWSASDRAADRIVASVRRPRFPPRYFPITRFGAVGDGTTDCTAAFAAAIAACNRAGGGHVVVPSGQFFTGAIHLLSHVDLHLPRRAPSILFSQDPNDYLPVVFTRWQGIELMNYSPFIYSYGQREHRGHRPGHAERAGRREPLVELEEPGDPGLQRAGDDGRRQRAGLAAGVRRRALPAAADDPAVPERHGAAPGRHGHQLARSGT